MDQATRARIRAIDYIEELEVEYADWDKTIADPHKRYELVHRISPVINALAEQLPLCGLPGDATRLRQSFDGLCRIAVRRLEMDGYLPLPSPFCNDPTVKLGDCKAEADRTAISIGQKMKKHLTDVASVLRDSRGIWPEINEAASRVILSGEAFELTPEGCRMVKLLSDARDWVSMAANGFSKPSEVKQDLPPAIRRHIQSISGKGYRWNPEL